MAPSATFWAGESKGRTDINYQTILRQAVRCPDPFVQQHGRWIVRRLAPYCSRIELTFRASATRRAAALAMGWETEIFISAAAAPKSSYGRTSRTSSRDGCCPPPRTWWMQYPPIGEPGVKPLAVESAGFHVSEERLTPHSGRRLWEKLALSMWTLACWERQHSADRTVDTMVLQCPIRSVVPV